MTKLIDKSALVAEIEKRIKETESMQPKFDQFWAGQISAFKGILKILNTLEVKEVDLDKEFNKYCENLYLIDLESEPYAELFECAKHFYELGLKTKGE
jgi:hypothetical protein